MQENVDKAGCRWMWRCSNSHTYASANADTRGMKPWIVSSRLGRSRRAGAERSVPPLRCRWAPRTPCLFLLRCCLLLCRNWRTSTAPRRRCAELSRLRRCALWFSSSDSAWLVGRKHGRLPHSQPPDKGVDRKRGRDQLARHGVVNVLPRAAAEHRDAPLGHVLHESCTQEQRSAWEKQSGAESWTSTKETWTSTKKR